MLYLHVRLYSRSLETLHTAKHATMHIIFHLSVNYIIVKFVQDGICTDVLGQSVPTVYILRCLFHNRHLINRRQ